MTFAFTPWQQGQQDTILGTSPTMGPQPMMRDRLDAARMAWRQTPDASYPSGYLGTINSRRGAREEDGIEKVMRRNDRPYTRGVHKESRLDPSDYLWPEEFNLSSGIKAEARGQKFVSPAFAYAIPNLTNDGKPGPSGDMSQAGQLRAMAPAWR